MNLENNPTTAEIAFSLIAKNARALLLSATKRNDLQDIEFLFANNLVSTQTLTDTEFFEFRTMLSYWQHGKYKVLEMVLRAGIHYSTHQHWTLFCTLSEKDIDCVELFTKFDVDHNRLKCFFEFYAVSNRCDASLLAALLLIARDDPEALKLVIPKQISVNGVYLPMAYQNGPEPLFCTVYRYFGIEIVERFDGPLPSRNKNSDAHEVVRKTKISMMASRGLHTLIALQALEFPALVSLAILDCVAPLSVHLPLHLRYKFVTTIKHFQR
jgi:hypothetical protein